MMVRLVVCLIDAQERNHNQHSTSGAKIVAVCWFRNFGLFPISAKKSDCPLGLGV